MTVTAKVKKRMIDNGRLVHAIVQGESNATTIVFRIEGEADLVASESLYLYLLYKRPNDQTVQLPILLDYTIEDGHFRTGAPLNGAKREAIEALGIDVYDLFYVNLPADNGSTVRVYPWR